MAEEPTSIVSVGPATFDALGRKVVAKRVYAHREQWLLEDYTEAKAPIRSAPDPRLDIEEMQREFALANSHNVGALNSVPWVRAG